MKKTKELLEKDIKSLFWKYAIPSMTMMVIMSVYFIVDAIFIGRGVGSEALGAVNLTIPIMVIVNSITMSLAIGASIIISIYLSKKKYVKANNTFTNILLINAVISLVFTGLGLVFSSQIATLLWATPETFDMVIRYLSIILYFLFFFTMQATLSSIIRNDGNPNLAMVAIIVSSLINIPLDALFIFGFDWGLTGAAIATGLSQVIAVIILSFHFILKKGNLRISKPNFEFKEYKKIFINTIPIMIWNIFLPISMFLMNITASQAYGTLGISAYAIVASISMFIGMALNGIAQWIQPIISFNHGQSEELRIKNTLTLGIKNSLIIAIVLCMGLFFFSDQVIGLFTTEDISSPLFSMTRKALLIYMVGFVFIGFNSLLASYFQSVEKIKDAMIVNTLRSIIILIPIALFVPLVLPNEYIWTILPISEFLISISILAFYYKKIFVKTPEISKS